MKNVKMTTILICMLMCLSSVLIIPDDLNVKATTGGGTNGKNVGLDYDYIYNTTEDLSYVIFDAYDPGEIKKGRCFGTKGEHYAAEQIIQPNMTTIGLSNPYLEQINGDIIETIDDKMEVLAVNLTIDNNGQVSYPEFYPLASALPERISNMLDYNYSFQNLKLLPFDIINIFNDIFFDKYSFNVNFNSASSKGGLIVGELYNATGNVTLPDNLSGYVLLLSEDDPDYQDKINGSENASGFMLIAENRECHYYDAPTPGVAISESDGEDILEILENYSGVFSENIVDEDVLTISYHYDETIEEYFGQINYRKYLFMYKVPSQANKKLCDWFYIWFWPILTKIWRSRWHENWGCRGGIIYDSSDETYYMRNIEKKTPAVPLFSINGSVGAVLWEDAKKLWVNKQIEIDYYLNQSFNDSVTSYNVIGNCSRAKDNSKIALICAHHDGFWGQLSADNVVGCAIVLGLAKYIEDYNLTPKFKLKFVTFCGEDWFCRGSRFYNMTHNETEENIKHVINFDMLGYKQEEPPVFLELFGNQKRIIDVIEALTIQTDYTQATGYGIDRQKPTKAPPSDSRSFRLRAGIKTMTIGKDYKFLRYHRTGNGHTEGDSMKYIDKNDLNFTTDLAWNLTKYYLFDPDCSFNGSVTYEAVDSPNDPDSLNDSINATISLSTSFPHDKVRVKAIMKEWPSNDTVFWKNFDFTVDSSGIQKVITVTLPPSCTGTTSGNYKLVLELYNSTGRIDEIIDTGSYDDIDVQNSSVYLYPRGNKKPKKPADITGPYTLRVFKKGSFTTSTTDDNEDQLQYQWAWRYHKPCWWLYEVEKVGPYDSGVNCTVEHWYNTRGEKLIAVRAREDFRNLFDGIGEAWSQYGGKYGSWSKWSDPHPVNVKFFVNIQMSPTVLASSLNALSGPNLFPSIQNIDSIYEAVASGGSEPYSYVWDFGSDRGYTKKIEYDFPSPSNETVNLTIKDNDGYSEGISIDVEVGYLSASYNVSVPSSYAEPLEKIIFNDTSAVCSDYHITNWTWDFDDGVICYDQHTNHTYELLGPYNVTLTVTDNQSNNDVYYKIITVACDYDSPVINYSSHEFIDFGNGFDISISGEFEDDSSGIKSASVNISYPDNTSGNYTMNHIINNTYTYNFEDIWQMGQYNYTLWAVDNANNSACSSGHGFTIKHVFGYSLPGSLNQSIEDRITGSVFTINKNGTADNISAYIQTNLSIPPKTKCMIYKKSDSTLIGTTEELTPTTGENASWVVFNFTGTKPTLVKDTEYVLTCWSNDTCYLYYDNVSELKGRYRNMTYGSSPDPANWTGSEKRLYSICCAFTTAPEITNVTASPDPVGFGFNVTISANVNDNGCGIDVVKVNISYPNNNTGNFTMSNIEGDTYQYIFNDTWVVGQYNYSIWARDNYNTSSISSGHSFNVSVNATISVCTIKDNYGNNEIINLTDPPTSDLSSIGYDLLNDGNVLHIWNEHNSYYFNISSGIQFTNHYDEYWSHNVLMLGYYNKGKWNLIYRTDELNGFNKDIDTDNETFVNATLWKDLTYKGYDFRLAIRYHLGVDNPDLTVIPYIKNLGDAIPFKLGFGWEIKDIKIANTFENDTIRLFNGTDWISYNLNQTLDNRYIDMDYNTTFYLEGLNEGKYFKRSLYLKWDRTLDYLLRVKSRDGQYNAPVTLFIKVGTLAENQEKYTELNWFDSDSWLGVDSRNYHSCCGYEGPFGPQGALDGVDVWIHLTTEDHWLIIDLKQMYNIKKVRGRSDTGNDPTSVDVYISNDPSNWESAVHTGITTWQDTSTWAEVDITDTIGRYINISITSTEGGAGSDYLEFGGIPIPMTIFDVYGEPLSDVTYYFNSYTSEGTENTWETNPTYMIDGSTSTFASTTINNDIEGCTGNTCADGTNLGSIFKVELRAHGNYSTNQCNITLVPIFSGTLQGSEYNYETTTTAGWSPWFNITDDSLAPSNWAWIDIATLDCDVIAKLPQGGSPQFTLYCSKVEIRVTYDPAPEISNPVPVDGSIGIPLTPTLNITVSDAYGESMNITWLSNSSSSWQVFGTNNSVTNGTYRQVFSNATENGKWWYWMVNVSDNTSYNVSNIFKFYTGYQSKIKNTGSTNIKGYLLIQVQYYNNSSAWIVADDTINETTPRTVNAGQQLGLDTIFNGLVNTANLSSYGNGTYRIYAAFRDPNDNILKCDDETELVATYEFTVTFE